MLIHDVNGGMPLSVLDVEVSVETSQGTDTVLTSIGGCPMSRCFAILSTESDG